VSFERRKGVVAQRDLSRLARLRRPDPSFAIGVAKFGAALFAGPSRTATARGAIVRHVGGRASCDPRTRSSRVAHFRMCVRRESVFTMTMDR
jgi:hypothetical protein